MEALSGVRSGFRPRRDLIAAKYAIIRDVRPSNTMRSTAPFAVSAAPAEAGHDMNAGVVPFPYYLEVLA